jgi:hypothetical protein
LIFRAYEGYSGRKEDPSEVRASTTLNAPQRYPRIGLIKITRKDKCPAAHFFPKILFWVFSPVENADKVLQTTCDSTLAVPAPESFDRFNTGQEIWQWRSTPTALTIHALHENSDIDTDNLRDPGMEVRS